MQVSVRELKNNLSKYLKLLRQGEPVVVTSQGTPVARLLPIPEIENGGLRRLLRFDWIHWNGKKPRGGSPLARKSAESPWRRVCWKTGHDALPLACFDRKLNRAAAVLGLSSLKLG